MFTKKSILLIFLLFIFSSNLSFSKENKILIKVNNEIITSVDILNEIKYLGIINKEFKSTENNLKIEIAKNSLIREKIKKIELQNNSKTFQFNESLFENIVKNYFVDFNINSLTEFEVFFKKNNLKSSWVKDKIMTEIRWNQLIYKKFKKKVKIDENEIKKNISNKKTQKEYLLSEILINTDDNKKFKNILKSINRSIKEKGFAQAALTYSVSETSKNGGALGWIKENVLNNKIKKNLELLKIGEFTKPIIIPGGFLILKIEDFREIKTEIDFNKEIQNIIEKKTNEQLNRFSNIYFNKIKKNTKINEI